MFGKREMMDYNLKLTTHCVAMGAMEIDRLRHECIFEDSLAGYMKQVEHISALHHMDGFTAATKGVLTQNPINEN